jgi:hypothetical protein
VTSALLQSVFFLFVIFLNEVSVVPFSVTCIVTVMCKDKLC